MTRPKTTCIEIAKIAGVSVGTVSRVINNRPGVSAARIERVHKAIAETGYRPSQAAGILAGKRTYSIGLLLPCPDLDRHGSISYGTASTFSGILAALDQTPFQLSTSTTVQDKLMDENDLLETPMLRQLSLEGLLLDLPHFLADPDKALQGLNLPYVLVNPRLYKASNSILVDDEGAASSAVEHLVAKGHRRIAYIGPNMLAPPHYSVPARKEGYLQAMVQAGLDPVVRDDPPTDDLAMLQPSARQQIERVVSKERCTAIIGYDAIWTSEIMQVCYELDLRVPRDVSVVSCDWEPSLDLTVVPVASIFIDRVEMGRQAVQMLVQRIENHGVSLPAQIISYSWIENQSVRELK
jgi:DNA-binding LacI/PurR family transcriptional regulator